jgi:hypothetical protein
MRLSLICGGKKVPLVPSMRFGSLTPLCGCAVVCAGKSWHSNGAEAARVCRCAFRDCRCCSGLEGQCFSRNYSVCFRRPVALHCCAAEIRVPHDHGQDHSVRGRRCYRYRYSDRFEQASCGKSWLEVVKMFHCDNIARFTRQETGDASPADSLTAPLASSASANGSGAARRAKHKSQTKCLSESEEQHETPNLRLLGQMRHRRLFELGQLLLQFSLELREPLRVRLDPEPRVVAVNYYTHQ